jgi:hypothetical protein
MDDADTDDIEQISSEVQNALIDSGYTKVLNMSNKLESITALCLHSVILSRKTAIDQFAHGLKPASGTSQEKSGDYDDCLCAWCINSGAKHQDI